MAFNEVDGFHGRKRPFKGRSAPRFASAVTRKTSLRVNMRASCFPISSSAPWPLVSAQVDGADDFDVLRTSRSSLPVQARKSISSQRESHMKRKMSRPRRLSAFLPEKVSMRHLRYSLRHGVSRFPRVAFQTKRSGANIRASLTFQYRVEGVIGWKASAAFLARQPRPAKFPLENRLGLTAYRRDCPARGQR